MKNPFKYCSRSNDMHARTAFDYWTLGISEMERDGFATELAIVYFEWLDDYCEWDLSRGDNIDDTKFN